MKKMLGVVATITALGIGSAAHADVTDTNVFLSTPVIGPIHLTEGSVASGTVDFINHSDVPVELSEAFGVSGVFHITVAPHFISDLSDVFSPHLGLQFVTIPPDAGVRIPWEINTGSPDSVSGPSPDAIYSATANIWFNYPLGNGSGTADIRSFTFSRIEVSDGPAPVPAPTPGGGALSVIFFLFAALKTKWRSVVSFARPRAAGQAVG